MDVKELYSKIQNCDIEKPFAFISYKSDDKEIVWEDVVHLQEMGYNLWIDKNLMETDDSWKDRALGAIDNINCKLIIFYLSKKSVLSEPCLSELTYSENEARQTHKDKNVPLIIVEVDPIENMEDFHNDVFEELLNDTSKNSETKNRLAKVQNAFRRNFVPDDNNKKRIKSKSLKDVSWDYYTEIEKNLKQEKVYRSEIRKECVASSTDIFEEPTDNSEEYRKNIAEYYIGKYSEIEILNRSFDLLKAFVYPKLSGNVKIDINGNQKYYLIEAPNSFGKSMFMKSTLLGLLSDCFECEYSDKVSNIRETFNVYDEKWLPLFLDFKEVRNKIPDGINDDNLFEALRELTLKDLFLSDKDFVGLIRRYNSEQKLILFIDGFDEVTNETRNRLINDVVNRLRRNSASNNIRIFISSRPVYSDFGGATYRQLYFNDYKAVRIMPLVINKDSVGSYIENYLDNTDYECDRETIIERIINNDYLKEFSTTPYILSMLIVDIAFTDIKNYIAINNIVNRMIDRFVNMNNVDERAKYKDAVGLIYQRIGYMKACGGPYIDSISNTENDFWQLVDSAAQTLISEGHKRVADILNPDNIRALSADIYTHYSLLATNETTIDFISSKVLIPYYSALYLLSYFHREFDSRMSMDDVLEYRDWKVFSRINKISDKYIADTVCFMLVMIMDNRTFSTRLNNLTEDDEELFLKSFVEWIESKKASTRVLDRIPKIWSIVSDDKKLGCSWFKDEFTNSTGLTWEDAF